MLLAGCGIVEDTLEGITASGPTPGHTQSSTPADQDSIEVTVSIASDAGTAIDLVIDVDSPNASQSFLEEEVPVPFVHDFTVPMDAFLPLRETTVEAHAAPGATYISCSIAVDGEVVATHRSEGSGAIATCENRLRLGPS